MIPSLRGPAAALLLLLAAAVPASALDSSKAKGKAGGDEDGKESSLIEPDTDLIDVPTAAVLDYGGYSSRTRFFSNGGVAQWLVFGVHRLVNIGASLNVDKLIGTSSPVQLTRPELQIKFRAYDGDRDLPAVALGYDGQGYLYNRQDLRYNQRQRGLYATASREVLAPGLEAHAGANVSDFNSNSIFGYMSASYDIQDKVLLMWEWDNINNYSDSRLNFGLKTYVTPSFHLDFAARGVGQGGNFTNGVARGAERIVMFKYISSF